MNSHRLIVFAAVLGLCSGCSKDEGAASVPAAEAQPTRRAVAAPIDVCSLVTHEEAQEIIGKKLEPPQKQAGGDCWYLREGGTDFGSVELILSMLPVSMGSEKEFDEFVASQTRDINKNMAKSGLGSVVFTAEKAEGVGSPAYFIDPGLYVLKGSRILAVALGGEKGVAIAKTAVARMP